MKVLYLDCFSGISGDMFLSALLDLGLDIKLLKNELDKLKLKGKYHIETKRVKYNAISALRFIVKESQKKERSLDDIKKIINKSVLDMDVKKRAVKMFEELHKAEKKIHGETDHFHELGLLDTIIDVVGAIAGLKIMGIKKVFASKINVGKGFVKTMHGLLPVPTPATAELLKGIPIFSNNREAELVTPTGALLLSEFVDEFKMPKIKIDRIGYGAGAKKFEDPPNLLRAYIGEIDENASGKLVIEANIDDMKPELYEYVMKKLFENGALDVYMVPVYMKKNRPGVILSCICNENNRENILETIFKETTTIGVRILHPDRIELERSTKKVKTKYGEVEVKISKYKSKIVNISPEYESCKKLAEKKGIPLKEIYQSINLAF